MSEPDQPSPVSGHRRHLDAVVESSPLLPSTNLSDLERSPSPSKEPSAVGLGLGRKKGLGAAGATVNMVKLMLGAGMLALPHAFGNAGLWPGVVLYPALSVLCWYTMVLLLRARDAALRSGKSEPALLRTYVGLGHAAFGVTGRWVVLIAVSALQLSFCSAYVLIVSNTVHYYFPVVPKVAAVGALLPILTGLASISGVQDLTVVSVFGVLVYVVGVFGVSVSYAVRRILSVGGGAFPGRDLNIRGLPLFCGTALYSLEGINGALPLEGAMARPESAPSAFLTANLLYSGLGAAFAAVTYSAGFGSVDVVTNALPHGAIRACVEWALALALVATHPLQLFPCRELIEERLFPARNSGGNGRARLIKVFGVRFLLVLVTCLVGAFIPSFGSFADFVGSLFLAMAGFVLPPLLYLRLAGVKRSNLLTAISAACILVGGSIFMVLGTYSSTLEIIRSFK